MLRRIVWLVIILCSIAVIYGCSAAPALYLDIGIGYKISSRNDLEPRNGGGRNPTGHTAIGLEFDHGWEMEFQHWSHVRDGSPFNDNREAWTNEFIIRKRFGGRR